MGENPTGQQDPDISESMAAEDYVLGRPYRADASPDPAAYQRGWSTAALEAVDNARENGQDA